MIRSREEHGLTLIEMMVALVVSLIVFGATLSLLSVFQNGNSFAQKRNETQDNARTAVDRLARELRNVVAPTTASFGALEAAGAYSMTFQTVDPGQVAGGSNVTNAMRVRYCLDFSTPSNETVWRQVKRWTTATAPTLPTATACPDPSGGSWDSNSRAITNATNKNGGKDRALFVYGPTSVSLVAQIISVQTNVFLDSNPGHRPGESQLTSAVALRNENRQPIVAFVATQVNGHVLLNASGSHDPDGLDLTYQWSDGASVLTCTAQQCDAGAPASGSSHTYTLQVADPGGLTNSTSQTVVIQ
jgi:prepilin-type N-terminal cleavage/methylation domain-containing protein